MEVQEWLETLSDEEAHPRHYNGAICATVHSLQPQEVREEG